MAWLLALIAILAIGGLVALSLKAPPNAPRVQFKQHPDSAAKSQSDSAQQENAAQPPSAVQNQNAARDTERNGNDNANDGGDEASEYGVFFGRRLKITDFVLSLFTGFLVLVGIGQGIFLYRTDQGTHKAAEAAKDAADTARDTLIAQSRAWVSPVHLSLAKPLEQGFPVKIQLQIVNTGREPGLGAKLVMKPRSVSYIAPGNDPSAEDFGPNPTCAGIEPIPGAGAVFYPGGTYTFPYDFDGTEENKAIFDAIRTGANSLLIEGCIAYRSAGKSHKSMFRFFLRDVPGQGSFGKNARGDSVPNWNFNATGTGNDAT